MSLHHPPTHEIVPILSGGGTRLPCHVGILHALEDMQLVYRHIVGVSGGSVVAALAAAGWDNKRMLDLSLGTDYRQFRGYSLLSLLRTGGLCNGDRFEQWIDELLEGRRFADMGMDLHVLATDIDGGGPVLFNRQTSPDLKVSQAVRYSMSIPLMFSFKIHENHIMTDGVILAEDALHRDWSGEGTPVVCFRLRGHVRRSSIKARSLLPLFTYIQLLVQTFMNAVSREYVQAEHWHNTVVIDTGDVSAVDFALPVEMRQELYEIGYKTAREVLSRKLTQVRPAH